MHLYQRLPMFVFEIEACENLKYITMAVRFNLDQGNLRLSLADWQTLPYTVRETLASFTPGDPAFTVTFDQQIREHLGHASELANDGPSHAWKDIDVIPTGLLTQCKLADLAPPKLTEWAALTPFQRYVMAKLSRREDRPNHCFVPAMLEFGLARATDRLH